MLKEIVGTRVFHILEKKKINTVEDVCRMFPSKYYDFSTISCLNGSRTDRNRAFLCKLMNYELAYRSGKQIVKCQLRDTYTDNKLYISWFANYEMYKTLQKFRPGDLCFVGGRIKTLAGYPGFYMSDPVIFKKYDKNSDLHIYTAYPKIKGISDKGLLNIKDSCLKVYDPKESLPPDIIKKYGLPGIKESIMEMHQPHDKERLKKAKMRLNFDDLFHFALRLEEKELRLPAGSSYNIRSLKITTKIIKSLPFSLTKDQKNAYASMIAMIEDGKRLNTLIQGDVGCGKTILAFLLMFAMADNGYQSVLLAPTQVLATQHYKELKEMAAPYGIRVVFLSSGQKKVERRQIGAAIRNGSALMIVGTHSVLGKEIEFKNLGLAITDEEHRFGVLQREAILQKAKNGVHTVTMSATPIPRSLTEVLFSKTTQVFNIHSMPNGRKAIRTAICSRKRSIYQFIKKELNSGHQAYVVCPLIDDSDSMDNLQSVEQTQKEYIEVFGESVAALNGKMKEEETAAVIESFKSGKTKILISTTVIEVGVNVPNATVIVINNAERFGLASLHQLRGRVGRGNYQGYCILNSNENRNPRLAALCQYTDGFHIAEADLHLRGPGDVIGTEQSGDNYYISLSLRYPEQFQELRAFAKKYTYNGLAEKILGEKNI